MEQSAFRNREPHRSRQRDSCLPPGGRRAGIGLPAWISAFRPHLAKSGVGPVRAVHMLCARPCGAWRHDVAPGNGFLIAGPGRRLSQALSRLGVSSFALVGKRQGGWVARELALLGPRKSRAWR